MNILHSAWKTPSHTVVTLARALVAPVRLILSAYLTDRARCRAIADLEVLPRTVLNDIGVHRVVIPLVVAEASREQRVAADTTLDAPTSPFADTEETASPTRVA